MIDLLKSEIAYYRNLIYDEKTSKRDRDYYDGIIDGLIIAIRELENHPK